jgi:hypothetical protein
MTQVLAARRQRGWTVPEILVDDVTHHIVMGGSFLSYSRQPGGPSQGTLRRWMRDPAFARAVAQACEIREDLLYDQICDVAETVPPGPIREMERAIGPLKRRIVTLRNRPTKPLGIAPRKGKPRALRVVGLEVRIEGRFPFAGAFRRGPRLKSHVWMAPVSQEV